MKASKDVLILDLKTLFTVVAFDNAAPRRGDGGLRSGSAQLRGHTETQEPSRLLGGQRTRPRGWRRGMAVGEEGWQERALHLTAPLGCECLVSKLKAGSDLNKDVCVSHGLEACFQLASHLVATQGPAPGQAGAWSPRQSVLRKEGIPASQRRQAATELRQQAV